MNKTVKKIVSLFVVMTFMLTLAMPTGFAAYGYDVPQNFGWSVKLYTDEACTTEAVGLQTDDIVYVQFALQSIKYFGAAQGKLTAENLTFEGTAPVREDYRTAPELGSNGANLELSKSPDEAYVTPTEAAFYITLASTATSGYENGECSAFPTTDTQNGVDLKVITYKAKVANTISRSSTATVTFTPVLNGLLVGVLGGEEDGDLNGSPIASVPAADKQVNASVGLPTISSTTLVTGNTDATAKPVEGNISTPGGSDPFGEGASYYFQATLSNGAKKYYKLNNAVKADNSLAGAYLAAPLTFNLAGDADETRTANFTIYDPAVSADYTVPAMTIDVTAMQYRINPADIPEIELPRGKTAITIADLGDSVQYSTTGRDNDWHALDLTGKTVTLDNAFTNKGEVEVGDTNEVAITISGGINLKDKNKVKIKTIDPEPTPVYALKTGADVKYTVYKASVSADNKFAQPLTLLQTYTDDTTQETTTTAAGLTYDVTNWAAFVEAAATAADGSEHTLNIAFADKEGVTATDGDITVILKEAISLNEYQVVEGQSFEINYKGTVDISKIKFEEHIQDVEGDDSTKHWVNYIPTGAITLSKFDDTKAGEYTVTVSVAGIELDPATVKVIVKKEPTYSVAWFNGVAPTLASDIEEGDIIDLLRFTATYDDLADDDKTADAVIEAVAAKDLTGLKIEKGTNNITVKVGDKTIGTLDVTFKADASNAKADLPVAGVELVGNLTGTVPVSNTSGEVATITLTVGANSGNNLKLLATVDGATDGNYDATVNFNGFAPVDVKIVVADGKATVELDPGAKLIAGYVAKANGDAAAKADINDNDFYAIAASFGAAPNGAKAKYDLNRDGKIDELDIQAVLGNLGTELTK